MSNISSRRKGFKHGFDPLSAPLHGGCFSLCVAPVAALTEWMNTEVTEIESSREPRTNRWVVGVYMGVSRVVCSSVVGQAVRVYTGSIEQVQCPCTQHIRPVEQMARTCQPLLHMKGKGQNVTVSVLHVCLAHDACIGCLPVHLESKLIVDFSCCLFFVATVYWLVGSVAGCWQAPLRLADGQSHPLLWTHCQTELMEMWSSYSDNSSSSPFKPSPSSVRPSEQRISLISWSTAISSHTGKTISLLYPGLKVQLSQSVRKFSGSHSRQVLVLELDCNNGKTLWRTSRRRQTNKQTHTHSWPR